MDRRPPLERPRRWCLCLPSGAASQALGLLYLVVNVAAILAGVIYLGVVHGTGHVAPESGASVLTAVLGACFVCALNAVACLLLVVGVRRARWELVLAWLAWYGVFQALLTVAWIGGVAHLIRQVAPALRPAADVDFSWRVLVPLLPVGIIVLAFVWYAYAAVVAHCRQLRAAGRADKVGGYSAIRET